MVEIAGDRAQLSGDGGCGSDAGGGGCVAPLTAEDRESDRARAAGGRLVAGNKCDLPRGWGTACDAAGLGADGCRESRSCAMRFWRRSRRRARSSRRRASSPACGTSSCCGSRSEYLEKARGRGAVVDSARDAAAGSVRRAAADRRDYRRDDGGRYSESDLLDVLYREVGQASCPVPTAYGRLPA